MTQPTFVAYVESDYTDAATANVTGSLSWVAGDVLYCMGLTDDQGRTLGTPTTAGSNLGAFSLVSSPNAVGASRAYYWKATASGTGNGTISSTANGSPASAGISVWQYRDVSAEGTPQTIVGSSAKTISVTRAAANSHILQVMADWNEAGDIVTDPTPATNATERETSLVSGSYDVFVTDWGDQGATGTTSYGITNHTGTVQMTGIAVEIKGTAGGGSAWGPLVAQQNNRLVVA